MDKPLSPAAQATWNAFLEHSEWETTATELKGVAAALRAAADQLGYGDGSGDPIINEYELLAIADELEGNKRIPKNMIIPVD